MKSCDHSIIYANINEGYDNVKIKIDVSKLTAKVKPSWHIVDAPAVIASVVTEGPAIIKFEKSRRIWQISMNTLKELCMGKLDKL